MVSPVKPMSDAIDFRDPGALAKALAATAPGTEGGEDRFSSPGCGCGHGQVAMIFFDLKAAHLVDHLARRVA